MKRKGTTAAEDIFAQLTARWALQILIVLSEGPRRFTDLTNAIPGVSRNVLTVRLRELEEAGFVERTSLPPPVAVQVYGLGERARDLGPALEHLAQWRAGLESGESVT